MRLHFLRHATFLIDYAGQHIILDPMLSDEGAMTAIDNSPNQRPNPVVPLPIELPAILDGLDAALVTHTHRDHWDAAAAGKLPKDLPLLGQPEDEAKFQSQGFMRVQSIPQKLSWQKIEIARTGGQHGTGEIGKKMAPVSGFVLRAADEPTLYIAGDTIWCGEVEVALSEFRPDVVIVNAGAAQFLVGDPITMTADDVIRVCQAAPKAQVIACHMEAINHCLLTRADLAFQMEAARVAGQVAIPGDGDWVG